MRQIRPRASHSAVMPNPVPTAVGSQTTITVDLRDARPAASPPDTEQEQLQQQLADVRQSIGAVMQQLARLIEQRDRLKSRLATLTGSALTGSAWTAADGTIVPWGFFDDDL